MQTILSIDFAQISCVYLRLKASVQLYLPFSMLIKVHRVLRLKVKSQSSSVFSTWHRIQESTVFHFWFCRALYTSYGVVWQGDCNRCGNVTHLFCRTLSPLHVQRDYKLWWPVCSSPWLYFSEYIHLTYFNVVQLLPYSVFQNKKQKKTKKQDQFWYIHICTCHIDMSTRCVITEWFLYPNPNQTVSGASWQETNLKIDPEKKHKAKEGKV